MSNKNVDFKELDHFIDNLEKLDGALIPCLHHAQEIYGYLPEEIQLHISRKLNIPASKVFGVVTFYSFFSTERKGKFKINICMGTACYVRGADVLVKEFEKTLNIKSTETTQDYLFSLDALRCVGACGLAPVVLVNDKVYGRLKPEEVNGIVEQYYGEGADSNE